MVVSKADSAVLEFRTKVSEVQGYMKTKASATSASLVSSACLLRIEPGFRVYDGLGF